MTYATVEQRVTIENLISAQLAEEEALDAQVGRMDRIRDAGVDAFGKIRDGLMEGARPATSWPACSAGSAIG